MFHHHLLISERGRLALEFNRKVRQYFGKKVDDFAILETADAPDGVEFIVQFNMYGYADISVTCVNGELSAHALQGKSPKDLSVKVKYKSNSYRRFFRKMQKEVALRIPDKYLIAKGWK